LCDKHRNEFFLLSESLTATRFLRGDLTGRYETRIANAVKLQWIRVVRTNGRTTTALLVCVVCAGLAEPAKLDIRGERDAGLES
jgi:hypothetical protein